MQFTKQQACCYNAAKSFSMVKLAAGVYQITKAKPIEGNSHCGGLHKVNRLMWLRKSSNIQQIPWYSRHNASKGTGCIGLIPSIHMHCLRASNCFFYFFQKENMNSRTTQVSHSKTDLSCAWAQCTATYFFLYFSERAFQKSISSSLEANFGIIFASMTDKPVRSHKKHTYSLAHKSKQKCNQILILP